MFPEEKIVIFLSTYLSYLSGVGLNAQLTCCLGGLTALTALGSLRCLPNLLSLGSDWPDWPDWSGQSDSLGGSDHSEWSDLSGVVLNLLLVQLA